MVSEVVPTHHGLPPLVAGAEYGPRPNAARSDRESTLLAGFSQDPGVELATNSKAR